MSKPETDSRTETVPPIDLASVGSGDTRVVTSCVITSQYPFLALQHENELLTFREKDEIGDLSKAAKVFIFRCARYAVSGTELAYRIARVTAGKKRTHSMKNIFQLLPPSTRPPRVLLDTTSTRTVCGGIEQAITAWDPTRSRPGSKTV
eukprot:1763383-Rhodomonas_salina.1